MNTNYFGGKQHTYSIFYKIFVTYKSLSLSLLFLFVFSVTISFAAPLYTTSNTTLDPQCLPTNPDCIVQQSLFTGAVNGQTLIGGTQASESLTLSSTTNATKGKIIFGTSAYDEATNRLGIGTATPTAALDVVGGVKVTAAAGQVSSAVFSANAFGDSITVGYGLSSPSTTGYIPLISGVTGWSFSNYAVSGSQVPDQAVSIYSTTVGSNTVSTYMLGTNDQDVYKTDANKLSVFKSGHQDEIAYLAIPASHKILGISDAVTYSGSWAATTGVGAIGKNTGASGATATFSVTGQNILIGMIQGDAYVRGTFTVTIDGVSQGDFTSIPTGAMVTQNGSLFGPYLLVFKNLSNTTHTVVITTTNTGGVFFDWAAGVTNGVNLGPKVYVANTPYQSDAFYTSLGTSRANTDAYNAAIAANVSELAAMGLNVYLVDVNSALDPITGLQADGLHPNIVGHQAIKNAFIGAIDTTTYSSNLAQSFSVNSNSNTPSFFLNKNSNAGSAAVSGIQLQNDQTSALIYRTSSTYTGLTPNTLYLQNTNGDTAFTFGGFEKMRILSTGNVGIGTATPTEMLNVAGNGLFTGTLQSSNFRTSSSLNNINIGNFLNTTFTGTGNVILGTLSTGQGRSTAQALTTGGDNILIGAAAGGRIVSGNSNIAIGGGSLIYATGSGNVAVGQNAGFNNSTPSNNSFFGSHSGFANTTGTQNVFIGYRAGFVNTTGGNLTFIGYGAGSTGTTDGLTNATAIGYNAQVTTSNSLILGNGVSVGIGTNGPTSKLDITTNALGTTQATTSGLALVNTTAAANNAQQISPAIRYSAKGWGTTAGTSQAVDFREYVIPIQSTIPTGYLTWDSAIAGGSYTTLMRLTSLGMLGIGTSSPSGVLTLGGNQSASAWGLNGINLQTAAATYTDTSSAASAVVTNNMVNSFGAPTLAATNTSVTYTNAATVYIAGAPIAGTNTTLTNRYALYIASGLSQFGTSSVTTGTTVAVFQNAGGTCSVVPSTSGGITCSSDYNLKKNITTLANNTPWVYQTTTTDPSTLTVLNKVLALQPVQYNWNIESDTDTKHVGFIAQDVQQLFPDLVTTDSTTGLLSLNYTGLLPYTIQALQDINIKVAAIPELSDKTLYTTIATFLDGIAQRGEAVVGSVKAKFITSDQVTTNKLCIRTTCVTQEQLEVLLQQQIQLVPSTPQTPSVESAPIQPAQQEESTPEVSQEPEISSEPVPEQ